MSLRYRAFSLALVTAIVILSGVIHVAPVMAAEVEDMHLVYEFDSQTLMVNVTHYSINKNDIIETIEIQKNGIFYMNRTYENQSVDEWVYDTFSISAVVDDNLTVTATCSKGYSITRWLIVTSGTATNPPSTDTTTVPSDNGDPPGTLSGLGPAVAASLAVIVIFIIIIAWLNPEKVPSVFKQLGSRIQSGLSWLGEKLKVTFLWLKASLGTFYQQIRTRTTSK